MLSNSWPSRCPFCDQPLLPCGRCDHVAFGSFVGRDSGVLLRERIFLHVMVGGGRGVEGPKELMGLVGVVYVSAYPNGPH